MAGSGQTTNTFTGDPANYSHDFQGNIDYYGNKANEQYNKYNEQYAGAQNYENAYNQAFANRQSYGDIMRQAEEEKGLAERRAASDAASRAVAATQQQMLTLPSTMNRYAGRVMTQAQRNAALNNQINKYNTTLASNVATAENEAKQYQNVLAEATNLAAGNYQSQQDALAAQMNQYQNAYNLANQAYQEALGQESNKLNVYQQMIADEAAHMQNEYQYWYGNLQDKWKQAELAAQKYAADAALRVEQYRNKVAQDSRKYKNWDFGNGYYVQEGPNGQAMYMRDNTPVSAAEFLLNTNQGGTNWANWNDIWNQGVRTAGVGSDTVSAFDRSNLASLTPLGDNSVIKFASKYGYLM